MRLYVQFFFLVQGQIWSASGGKRDAQRNAEVMKTKVRVKRVEHVKNVAGTVREAYAEVWGKDQHALCGE